ncbi:FtsQ-type POTRA domain-containing protein [Komarekiella sp. 'clone 1']|uniref:FtsQ-type POTRA domain-containing protein n=1 Tax=Komarekiella delphini-convector SJRDD-AB1 TaxID=2593771 RepID=A0AA40VT80_9NOST|nr:FtsQ-type POTRA domain-containing protein [Komarekiella delphini-convector]MBD6618181.1 FtsQ-type POTRA domain-containing protein [Komarekiella delphini-convector SJRDD-AB1]
MAGIVSVSRTDLAQRRKKLRRQRQMKILQTIWRTFAISGLAGGLLWVAIQPIWVLNTPKQIVMKSGNQLLSDDAIKSLLVLSYPQSLWRIKPSAIADSLKQQPTIAQATVSRRLFPPGLNIEIQERIPVAIAQKRIEEHKTTNKKVIVGLLDANGVWMPLEKYKSLNPTSKLPTLQVIGLPEQYSSYWTQLYQAVSQSSVKVIEIDCEDPTNLILKTELGKVHLGVPSLQLPEQIRLLAQMRHLPAKLNSSQIEYIDLKNPESPLVQVNQKKPKIDSQNP